MSDSKDLPNRPDSGPDPEHLSAAVEAEDVTALRARVQACLPDHTVLNCLGRGGMGAVFRAHHLRLDRPVAIKVLLPAPEAVQGWEERFLREARALARLSHPGIVAVYDYGQAEDLCWIVMEYVDGANLRELMQDGRLKPEEALAVVPQVCAALQFAHDRGVVHRDLKPENVLLDEGGNVRIADFGLAKLMDAGASMQLTMTDQAMGTLRYMAPEQLERPREVDHRADIFSLGVVFYEMLTGLVPTGAVQPPSAQGCTDPRLDEVVMRSMEREPEERYQRAGDVGQRLEELKGQPQGEGTSARSVPRSRSGADTEHDLRDRLRLASVVVCVIALLTLLGTWYGTFPQGVMVDASLIEHRGYEDPFGMLTGVSVLGILIVIGVLRNHRRGITSATCQLLIAPLAIFWPFAFATEHKYNSDLVLPLTAAGLGGLLVVLAVLQIVIRESGESSLGEAWADTRRGIIRVFQALGRAEVDTWIAIAAPALCLLMIASGWERHADRYSQMTKGWSMMLLPCAMLAPMLLRKSTVRVLIGSVLQVACGAGIILVAAVHDDGDFIGFGLLTVAGTIPRWIRIFAAGRSNS